MSIIICPECNEEISDTEKRCSCCGAIITVCPECKKIHIGETCVCDECGYVLKTAVVDADETKKKKESAYDVDMRFDLSIGAVKHVFSNVISIVLELFWLILIVVAAVHLFSRPEPDEMSETLSSIDTCLTFVVIAVILERSFTAFKDTFRTVIFINWSKKQNVDLNAAFGNTLEMDFDSLTLEKVSNEIISAQWCLKASAYERDYALRSKLVILQILVIALNAVATIIAAVFSSINAEIYLAAELMESEALGIDGWKFSMIDNWVLIIIGAAFFFAGYLLSRYCEKKENASDDDFVKAYYPDYYQKYVKCISIKEWANYVVNRANEPED